MEVLIGSIDKVQIEQTQGESLMSTTDTVIESPVVSSQGSNTFPNIQEFLSVSNSIFSSATVTQGYWEVPIDTRIIEPKESILWRSNSYRFQ